jgi:hypothetical protein
MLVEKCDAFVVAVLVGLVVASLESSARFGSPPCYGAARARGATLCRDSKEGRKIVG